MNERRASGVVLAITLIYTLGHDGQCDSTLTAIATF